MDFDGGGGDLEGETEEGEVLEEEEVEERKVDGEYGSRYVPGALPMNTAFTDVKSYWVIFSISAVVFDIVLPSFVLVLYVAR